MITYYNLQYSSAAPDVTIQEQEIIRNFPKHWKIQVTSGVIWNWIINFLKWRNYKFSFVFDICAGSSVLLEPNFPIIVTCNSCLEVKHLLWPGWTLERVSLYNEYEWADSRGSKWLVIYKLLKYQHFYC